MVFVVMVVLLGGVDDIVLGRDFYADGGVGVRGGGGGGGGDVDDGSF